MKLNSVAHLYSSQSLEITLAVSRWVSTTVYGATDS